MFHSEPTWRSPGLLQRLLATAALFAVCGPAFAQPIELFGEKQGNFGSGAKKAGLEVEAALIAAENGTDATLTVVVTIPTGFYLYSMDPGFSARTKITLTAAPGLQPAGEFRADRAPKRAFDEILGQEVEKFTDKVTWSLPLRIVDPAAARVSGTLVGTYCSTGEGGLCIRADETFSATLTRTSEATATTPRAEASPTGAPGAAFTVVETPQVGDEPGPATLRFSLSPENAQPGENVTLSATMTLGDGWHTYSPDQPKVLGTLPTTLALKQSKGLTPIGDRFVPDRKPEQKTTDAGEPALEHSGTVTWSRQFRVDDAAYGIEGSIRYVTCRAGLCLQPQTIAFALGDLKGGGPLPAALPSAAGEALTTEFETAGSSEASLPLYLGLAFLGGLILNIMPCVLPVVAIKVMSFVQHAGDDRGRVFLLNAVYAAGVISVFLFLAALAALPQWFGWLFEGLGLSGDRFSWGGLFQSEAFNLAMACLVFAMGLSLLGVFEIPIPGMVGSAAAGNHNDGLTGAFLTGIFATLLATPCTGPFMGTTLAWSVKQTPAVTFLIWGTMGLGMASPYLLFGLVPGAVKLLPKPGAWMVQFKELAGFVLMGTVVFILSSVNTRYMVPALIMLLGVALALWMIGMVQFSHSKAKRRAVSLAGLALGTAVAFFGYQLTTEPTHKLAWEPFTTARVNELRGDGKTVLIDFTADWCANCITNELLALNTEETKSFVDQHGIVTLRADYSDYSQEITEWLDAFDRQGIPLTVIFPADRPNDPILLDGLFSQRTLLKSLDDAVRPRSVARANGVKTAEAR